MRIRAERALILAVDFQAKLLAMLGLERSQGLLQRSLRLLASGQGLQIPILLSVQNPQGLGPLLAELGDFGEALPKTTFSCVATPNIRKQLQAHPERRQILLLGVETHICILQTALELQDLGWQPVIVRDCVESREHQQKDWALERMTQAGITLCSSESLFYELLGSSDHFLFRELAPHWRKQ